MEQVESERAPHLTAKPAEYQPVPTVEINANYPTITTAPQTFTIQDPPHYVTDNGPRPNNFMVLTLITLFFCMGCPTLFCSVVAVIYSLQVDLAWDVGHRSGARSASENAKKWAIAAIITGVIITALAVVITIGVSYGAAIGIIRYSYYYNYGYN